MATHRYHNNAGRNDFFGIQTTDLVEARHMIDIEDPLLRGDVDEKKALASIPSMFARPRFIEEAFEYCRFDGRTVSTYDKVVSKTLDLLEKIFNSNEDDYTFEMFDFDDQIAQLEQSTHNGHKLLATVLAREKSNMKNVDSIFLIKDRDSKLLGGTSPFTFVYPSPTFNGEGIVKGLIGRSESFRLFLYRYYCVMDANAQANTAFWAFVANSYNADNLANKPVKGQYTDENLKTDHDPILTHTDNADVEVVAQTNMKLYRVKAAAFTSELYIKSELIDFKRETTPIVLPTEPASRKVCGNKQYSNRSLNNNEQYNDNNDSNPRPIPGETPTHAWISAIDFFEDDLLVYPSEIDDEAFLGCKKIKGDKYVLPPLRTLFFKYFNAEDVQTMLGYEYAEKNPKTLKVKLTIPVCDENQQNQATVVLSKNYTIPDNISSLSTFNVAISPFCRIAENPVLNSYHIMMLHTTECVASATQTLSVYKNHNKIGNDPVVRTELSENAEGTTYYKATDFDNIEVNIAGKCGRIIPKFGNNLGVGGDFCYAVDFGTTNTNIAFKIGANENNFSKDILEKQIKYLSTGEAETEIAQLQFIPRDGVDYPIRTVMGSTKFENEQVNKLFGETSIGFYYQKKLFDDSNKVRYMPELKWKMLRVNDDSNGRADAFLEEILWLIKNHWMMNAHDAQTAKNAPKFVFTYPDDDFKNRVEGKWKRIYEKTFGVAPDNTRMKCLPESLAPCISETAPDGLLNVDIGGGTTDIQYKRSETCFYNSILFAADDIWGDGYEHVDSIRLLGKANKSENRANNRYRVLAGSDQDTLTKITDQATRELMSYLFKNNEELIRDNLAKENNEDNESNADRRKPMFLHFAALIYHITKWLNSNGIDSFPKEVKFTGMGSGYVKWLVGNDVQLTKLVKGLVSAYGGNVVDNFEVCTERSVAAAKQKTAKGALEVFANNQVPNNNEYNITDINPNIIPREECQDNTSFQEKYWIEVEKTLKECIDNYNEVANKLTPTLSISCPNLKWETIKDKAKNSFREMAKENKKVMQNAGVRESVFVWALKNSLWQIS